MRKVEITDPLVTEYVESIYETIEMSARLLVDTAALVAEHGGGLDELREIIAKQGVVGDSMLRAVRRYHEHGPSMP